MTEKHWPDRDTMPDAGDAYSNTAHRFAWDGFSFMMPGDWNLSAYHFGYGDSHVEIQDDFALRLQFDWIRSDKPLNEIRLMEKYDKACGRMEEGAEAKEELPSPADGWHAALFTLPGKQQFVVAVHIGAGGRFFGLLRLFFDKTGRRQPKEILDMVGGSFVLHDGPDIPWHVYDMAIEVNRCFRLASTTLQAGCPLLQFQWRRRRLMVWNVAMADWVLKQRPLAEWVVDFLGKIRSLEGVRFTALDKKNISCGRRRLRFPAGHFEDVARLCYRYRAFARHLPERNTLLVCVYHYRLETDVDQVGGNLVQALLDTPGPA